jgi:ketosteroid isomerase-like protein
MGEILAPEYVFISAAGGAGVTSGSMLRAYAAGALHYEEYHADSVRVRVFGDAAVVTGLIVRRGRSQSGGDVSGRFRSTRVYVRRGGRWQLVSAQETRVATQ